MKRKRIQSRKLRPSVARAFVLAVVFFSVQHLSAQKAAKFDEIPVMPGLSYEELTESTEERFKRFANVVKREKKRLPYILHYRARVREDRDRSALSSLVSRLRWMLDADDKWILDGGVRELDTIELWLIPRAGEFPRPTPTFDRSEAIDCPGIRILYDNLNFDRSHPIGFTANAGEGGAFSFNWTLSDGKIITKNGEAEIEVDVSAAKSERVTAFVEVRGIPLPCKNTQMAVAEFGKTARLMDRFGRIPNGDMRGRLDTLLATLARNPTLKAYVYNYGGRVNGNAEMAARRRMFANHFRFRNADTSRITILDAGYREDVSTDFWLVPPEVPGPIPTPTVDATFVVRPIARKRGGKR